MLSVALIQASTGCAMVQVRIEPRYIAVRNLSTNNVALLYLAVPKLTMQKGKRYASISPVPREAMQSAQRPAGAAKLPDKIEVSWQTEQGEQFSQAVNLKSVLREFDRVTTEDTLIFIVRPDNSVEVKIEQVMR